MKKPKKILIIKTGFSEFLDKGISTTVSLGDVLLCTSILHRYKNDRVTWLTSHQGSPLLKDNPHIHDLLIFAPAALDKIAKGSYDVIVNLEKDIGICTYLERVKAKKKYGFFFDVKRHDISTYTRSTRYLLTGQENHADVRRPVLDILFETVGGRWGGETAILNLKRKVVEKYDIGFNYAVGPKWPTKAWPKKKWQALHKILKRNYSVSWQQGHKNIQAYLKWIASCRVIVTCDSLGQIVGQALGKEVITLFGPTNHARMEGIPHTHTITSKLKCPYMPCYLPVCRYKKFCMDYISPDEVAKKCRQVLTSRFAG